MSELLTEHETAVRAAAFLGVLLAMAVAEALAPRRPRRQARWKRWPLNLAMVGLGALLIRLAVPLAAVEAALQADRLGWGLFHQIAAPGWLAFAASVILLDLVVYAQHVAFHKVPALWRIHRMHHSDLELDASSGVRFHPIEFALSMLIKAGAVFALGAPVAAVIFFEVLLNATAVFNHSNLKLPGWLDRALRTVLVTPDFHIVHHSIVRDEQNRNFGFNAPWWDYIFRTYKARPKDGPEDLVLGIAERRSPGELTLKDLLWMPFSATRTPRGDAAVRERDLQGPRKV